MGALGAVGFGASDALPSSLMVLTLIPLACAYVDLVCTRLWLQIHVTGAYLRLEASVNNWLGKYEEFAQEANRKGFFGLERIALYWTTIGLSAVVAGYCTVIASRSDDFFYCWICLGAALVGGLGSVLLYSWLKRKLQGLDALVNQLTLRKAVSW